MFSPDIVSLRQFYATPLGQDARALIAARLGALWPPAKGDIVLGIGYCTPYFAEDPSGAEPPLICMPAHQGGACWPPDAGNRVFLSHESELPLPENSVNRVLLLHSAEHSEQLSWMMEEIWRVLTPGGRVLAIVPNRLGFWSRSSRSPFGYGRPFSMPQLRELMTRHHFTGTRSTSALFTPPTHLRFIWRIAPSLEKIGQMLCPFFGGVLMVEAEKQIYASIKQPVQVRKRYGMPIPAVTSAMGVKRE